MNDGNETVTKTDSLQNSSDSPMTWAESRTTKVENESDENE